MTVPLVSVVIATYNTAGYLPETVNSALAQTWPNLEVIVVDDGSTDDTTSAIAPFASRIRYEYRSHGGLAAARNEGIRLARGDYIALLDADDLWLPQKIAIQVALAERHPQSGMIVCDAEEFCGEDVLVRNSFPGKGITQRLANTGEVTGDFRRRLIEGQPILCPAQVLIPRSVIDHIGPFADFRAQDYDYYLRIGSRYPVTFHGDVLARWRYRPDSMSGSNTDRPVHWASDALVVLEAYRATCRQEDRELLERRIRATVLSLGHAIMTRGRMGGRADASALLLTTVAKYPSPTLLVFFGAMWAPEPLFRLGVNWGGPLLRRARSYAGNTYRRATAALRGERFGKIERRSPRLDRIVPRNARIDRIAAGFAYTEGPVWTPEGHLLFGDLPNNVIWRWDPSGGVSVVRKRSGYSDADRPPGFSMGSNGMTLDGDGRLVVCEPGNRRVTRTEADGSITVMADRYEGKRLNSPNDLVHRRSDGSLYFTDPPHGLVHEDADPAKELAFSGIFRLSGARLELLSRDMTRPNGLAFSPDERYLYVSNSDPLRKTWIRYEVQADGTIANGHEFLDLTAEPGHAPDGLKVDIEGNLYLTGPGGVWVLSPAFEVLGIIRTRQEPSNLAWGDADRRTLFLTAPNEVYRIRVAVAGSP